MEKIIQLRESEYNELYRVASLNQDQIYSEAEKMWKNGPAQIQITVRTETDLNDYFKIKCSTFVHNNKFIIPEDVRNRFQNIVRNQVADSIEYRFGSAVKTVNEYNKRIRHLDMLKFILYPIAISGWVAFVLLFVFS